MFVFVKGRGTCGSGERNVKIWIDFRKSPRFSLTSNYVDLESIQPFYQLKKKITPYLDVLYARKIKNKTNSKGGDKQG
jgi:hypothetical protein